MTGAPVFSADPARVDRARVHRWLSEESYWARGRTREAQDAAIDGSRVYGVYDGESGEQLAFATADAHGLYAQFGFAPLPAPERWMTRGT